MKSFLAFALVVFATVTSLFAQAEKTPTVQDVPTLQEWWRADNLGYGVPYGRDDNGGMTWLDNFYNGKGALVVSTAEGVKTWQMRFPGDTANVFTWQGRGGPWRTLEGGNPNIKTGDFNGDNIADYIDAWGNIYEGTANGEPPKTESVAPAGHFYPWLIADINNDGLDDIIHPAVGYPPVMQVISGKSVISEMKVQAIPLSVIDTNNRPAAAYMVSPTEMRVVCRRYFWHYNKQEQIIDRDGYRLVRIWWDGNGFQSELLDEFTADVQNGTGLYWLGALLPQPNGRIYWLSVSKIQGQSVNTNLTVYDLSKGKLGKLYTTRIDSIGGLGVLTHSVNGDSLQDWFIQKMIPDNSNYGLIIINSGNLDQTINSIGTHLICGTRQVISVADVSGDKINDIAMSGKLGSLCFRIVKGTDGMTAVEEDASISPLTFATTIPLPVQSDGTITVGFYTPVAWDHLYSLYTTSGIKIADFPVIYYDIGKHNALLNLTSFHLSLGTYIVKLSNSKASISTIILVK